MTDSNRQPRTEANRQRDERGDQDELGGYRTAMGVQETTMEQGQQAIRQTAELQRSFAQATLRGIESQQAAQRQAFEFTKAAIGSYVDTMNSMLPALEDAQQQFVREAANAGAETTEQFQQTTREPGRQSGQTGRQSEQMGRQSEQIGRQSEQMGQQTERTGQQRQQANRQPRRQTAPGDQQPPETGRTAERRSGGQTTQIRNQGGEFQRADAPHERGIRPPSGGQRGGGYQPPQQSGTQSQPPRRPSQTPPSQSEPAGQRGQPHSRPPGATEQSGGPTGYQQSEGPTDRHRTERGQSEFRDPGERDGSSDRPGGRPSPTHQQRQEPPQTGSPGDGSSRREIPISSSSDRPQDSSGGADEHGARSDTVGESNEAPTE